MDISYIHLFVENAEWWQDWLRRSLHLRAIATLHSPTSHTEVLSNQPQQSDQAIWFVVSAPCNSASPVAAYLACHPPGVVDVGFRVDDLDSILARHHKFALPILRPPQSTPTCRWTTVQGWGQLRHTLIEQSRVTDQTMIDLLATEAQTTVQPASVAVDSTGWISAIDHAVLNVARGDLTRAIAHYSQAFGFQPRQQFTIQTDRSALFSQVLTHPRGSAQLPINEPASATSQIQEFLDHNRGPGIQHIALQTRDILVTLPQLRQRGISFIQVPFAYYEQLRHRPGFALSDDLWRAIAQQQVLVDWQPDHPQALLLQTFTQPIFPEPTFFFELIERRQVMINDQICTAQGFGEGNFRALFEAIEREQMKRGSLEISEGV
jgi:4-hydroxyphenylpyruvate dioxygenase